jgi:probable HAF family extracellular repeat protein
MDSSHQKQLIAVTLFAALALPIALATQGKQAPRHYIVTDLGPTQSFADGINNKGWVTGTAILADGVTQHAFLWREGIQTDLGTLGGPNSSAFFKPGESAQVAGNAETSTRDPLGEDFCGYGTQLVCLGFIWQDGLLTPLATLGGNNGWANGGMNNQGQAVGVAENATPDPTCATPGLEARPVIWEK